MCFKGFWLTFNVFLVSIRDISAVANIDFYKWFKSCQALKQKSASTDQQQQQQVKTNGVQHLLHTLSETESNEDQDWKPEIPFGNVRMHELLNRWTDIFILPRTAWGGPFNPYNITQTHSNFVKL